MDILKICSDSNVTLKSTYRNPSIPVDVVCNECGLRFPVAVSGSTKISCPACSFVDIVNVNEEEIEKIELEIKMIEDGTVEKAEEYDYEESYTKKKFNLYKG